MTVVILPVQFVAAFAVSVACRVLDREGVNMSKSREAGTQCPHTISTLWGQRHSTVSTMCREWPTTPAGSFFLAFMNTVPSTNIAYRYKMPMNTK